MVQLVGECGKTHQTIPHTKRGCGMQRWRKGREKGSLALLRRPFLGQVPRGVVRLPEIPGSFLLRINLSTKKDDPFSDWPGPNS